MAQLGYSEKWTLRYVVAGLLFFALTAIEGMMMRTQLVNPQFLPANHFYAVMTVHPIVGIYGFAYMCIMGAFYFLVPYLLKKEIYYKKLIPINFFLQAIGVLICWCAGFFAKFSSLYTLYWPLPVWTTHTPLLGTAIYGIGLFLVEVNILLFSYNIFSTIFRGKNAPTKYTQLPVFIVAIARGSWDTVINAIVLLTASALLLIYSIPALVLKLNLNPHFIDPLLYKNWFWWGLDMIADGNVLMYTAGTWYLLVPLLVGRPLFGEKTVRNVILADLLVSMFVWSHHLLADRPQPTVLRLLSGQFVTWGEFLTVGLSVFASLMTIWLARPVKFTPALKCIVASMFGFMAGAISGLIQANFGLNVVLHNTQWVIGTHGHTMLLLGLSMLIFSVIYALLPLLTKVEIKNNLLVNLHLWCWIIGVLLMTNAMGWAGTMGMLRRTIYDPPIYQPYMITALLGGILISFAFICFLVNLIKTLGFMSVVRLFIPQKVMGYLPRWVQPASTPEY